ncbi:hypothetical protein DIPPA_13701 [Diplonema papillatum]|nr:hypothetical protein DIPPA_13701 [Diplonema papillatum]
MYCAMYLHVELRIATDETAVGDRTSMMLIISNALLRKANRTFGCPSAGRIDVKVFIIEPKERNRPSG